MIELTVPVRMRMRKDDNGEFPQGSSPNPVARADAQNEKTSPRYCRESSRRCRVTEPRQRSRPVIKMTRREYCRDAHVVEAVRPRSGGIGRDSSAAAKVPMFGMVTRESRCRTAHPPNHAQSCPPEDLRRQ